MPETLKEFIDEEQKKFWKSVEDMYPNGLFTEEDSKIIFEAAGRYGGNATVLSAAIGAYVIAKLYGWKVVRLMHSNSVYTKYQRIMGVDFADISPPEGPFAEASLGYTFVKKMGEFWKGVRGQISVPDRQEFKQPLPDKE
jgi:hypothetical protein